MSRSRPQTSSWAIGYNSLALPIAAGVFETWGLTLRPEIAAISMSGSSILVAVNALAQTAASSALVVLRPAVGGRSRPTTTSERVVAGELVSVGEFLGSRAEGGWNSRLARRGHSFTG